MRPARLTLTLFFAMAASSVYGAVAVLGPGPAAGCFEAAKAGAGLVRGLKACDEALATNLTTQDRFATLINRGVVSYALKDKKSAMADFRAGVELQPANGEGYIDRGLVFASEMQFPEAVEDFNKGIALGSRNAYLGYYNRALIEELGGNVQAAYRDYLQTLSLEPGFQLAADQLKRFRVESRPGASSFSFPAPRQILSR